MHRNHVAHQRGTHPHRGQALIIALGLVLALTVLVAATQFLVVTHLGNTKVARYNERALLMADQGVNQILYSLDQGGAPPVVANPPTLINFAAGATNGAYTLTAYPAGSTTEGYYACLPAALGSAGGSMYVYGWSHGAVRRVCVGLAPVTFFDWAGVYAINPSLNAGGTWDTGSPNNYSWTLSDSASVVGPAGSEGRINFGAAGFYVGPVILAGPNARFNAAAAPGAGGGPAASIAVPAGANPPGAPPGFNGNPMQANPFSRNYPNRLYIPTADQAAVNWIQQSQGVLSPVPAGVTYYRSVNNNATGLRYLVWDGANASSIRELGPNQGGSNYTVTSNNTLSDANWNLSASALSALQSASDLKNGEVIYGIRVYPGDYYFDSISQSASDALYLRTYSDTQFAALAGQLAYSFTFNANPNTRTVNGIQTPLSNEANVRFWIGNPSSGAPVPTGFSYNIYLEYATYASRFRVYDANTAGISLSGNSATPPPPLLMDLLCYNLDANGNGYGSVSLGANNTNLYLYGSVAAWQVNMTGGATVEKQSPEVGVGDSIAFRVTSWSEQL